MSVVAFKRTFVYKETRRVNWWSVVIVFVLCMYPVWIILYFVQCLCFYMMIIVVYQSIWGGGGGGGGGWYDGSFKTTWLSLISTQLSSVEDDYDSAVIYIETKVQCNSISPN